MGPDRILRTREPLPGRHGWADPRFAAVANKAENSAETPADMVGLAAMTGQAVG